MAKWLIKSEKSVYPIDKFAQDGVTSWGGVRNYQARNFLKSMKEGEDLLFYHSVEEPTGIMGLGRVKRIAYPDPTQFDPKSEYFDRKASKDEPRWFSPDVEFVRQFKKLIPIKELRKEKALKNMELLKRGSRLSVQPVTEEEFRAILKMAL